MQTVDHPMVLTMGGMKGYEWVWSLDKEKINRGINCGMSLYMASQRIVNLVPTLKKTEVALFMWMLAFLFLSFYGKFINGKKVYTKMKNLKQASPGIERYSALYPLQETITKYEQ